MPCFCCYHQSLRQASEPSAASGSCRHYTNYPTVCPANKTHCFGEFLPVSWLPLPRRLVSLLRHSPRLFSPACCLQPLRYLLPQRSQCRKSLPAYRPLRFRYRRRWSHPAERHWTPWSQYSLLSNRSWQQS